MSSYLTTCFTVWLNILLTNPEKVRRKYHLWKIAWEKIIFIQWMDILHYQVIYCCFSNHSENILKNLLFMCKSFSSDVVYWPSTRPNMPFQSDAHIPMASNRKKPRRRIWLTKWDKVKAHDTLIHWCTGRVWPLNCLTVISAWWRSNMPFQRLIGWLSGLLNYYITRWRQEVRELEIRQVGDQMSWRQVVVGKATTQKKGKSEPPVVLETRWWQDVGEKASTQQKAAPPGLRLSIRRTRKTQRWCP